jgi:cholesterol transport system auxiliary component
MKMRRVITALLLLGLAGCSLPGAREQAIRYYVLDTPLPEAVAESGEAERPVLLLRDAEAGVFTQSLRLVYRREPGTQAYYQYAFWTEPPPRRLQTLLRQRLLVSGRYAGVVPLGAGVRGDYQLNFRLIDFFHDASVTPGRAVVKLEAELLERGSGRLLAQRAFSAEAGLTAQDASAAAVGLASASAQIIEAMTNWLASVQPKSNPASQAR